MVEKDSDKIKFVPKTKFALSVDGSMYALNSFNFVMHEFFTLSDFIFVYHIKAPNQLDLPYAMQAVTIKSLYESKLISTFTKEHYSLEISDQDLKEVNHISQVYSMAVKAGSNVMFVGFQGSQTKPKEELTSNIRYLIKNVKLPCFIIKDYNPRSEKQSKGYLWLVCIEAPNSRSWNAFLFALNYIKKNDQIICFHINHNSGTGEKIKSEFEELCSNNSLSTYSFQQIDSTLTVSSLILNNVNYTENTPDFVVIGHNSSKYTEEGGKESPAVEVLKKAQTNILFYTTQ